MYGLRIGGNLSLTQGPDDDNVEIDYSTIGGNISVTQGDGAFLILWRLMPRGLARSSATSA